jgi:AcrR family transcriptional regulator
VGYRHSREEIVAATAATALEHGIGALTYRRVADRLGISDRMVVYYLPTKADLVHAAATALSASLQGLLLDAFGDRPRPVDELLRAAWPVFATTEADRVAAIFLEVIGLAAAGAEPFDELAPALMSAWVAWLADRVAAPSPVARREGALGIVARIDGLLVIRRTLGPEAADTAARSLGITGRRRRPVC